MINQQLLDFIKQQILKGVDNDTISKELISGGWTIEDIKEGFNEINNSVVNPIINQSVSNNINNPILTQDASHLGKKILLIIVVLFIVVGGVSSYYFRNDIPIIKDFVKNKVISVPEIKKEEDNQQIQVPQEEQDKSTVISEPVINKENEIATKKISLESGQISCGKDMDCFISKVKDCTPSFVENTSTLSLFGMVQTNKTKMVLSGFNSSQKCLYSSYVLDAKLDYSPEMKAEAKASGVTDEELALQLIESNESVKSTIGMTIKCSFTTSYLTQLLTNWSKGNSSSNDYSLGNCTATDADGKPIQMM